MTNRSPSISSQQNAPRLGRERAIPHLLGLLHDERPDIRMKAAAALGNLGRSYPQAAARIVPPLAHTLTQDAYHMAQVAAAHAIGLTAQAAPALITQATEALISVLRDAQRVYVVRLAACDALGLTVPLLSDPLEQERTALALIDAFHTAHPSVRESAATALGKLGPVCGDALRHRIVMVLAGGLRSARPHLAMACAWALGEIADPRAIPALRQALTRRTMAPMSRFSEHLQPYGGPSLSEVAAHSLDCIGTEEALAAVRAFKEGSDG